MPGRKTKNVYRKGLLAGDTSQQAKERQCMTILLIYTPNQIRFYSWKQACTENDGQQLSRFRFFSFTSSNVQQPLEALFCPITRLVRPIYDRLLQNGCRLETWPTVTISFWNDNLKFRWTIRTGAHLFIGNDNNLSNAFSVICFTSLWRSNSGSVHIIYYQSLILN